MKLFAAVILLLTSISAFAAEDACYDSVLRVVERDRSFQNLAVQTRNGAIDQIQDAQPTLTPESRREEALELARERGNVFYGLTWMAMDNAGYNLIIVRESDCKILRVVAIYSDK